MKYRKEVQEHATFLPYIVHTAVHSWYWYCWQDFFFFLIFSQPFGSLVNRASWRVVCLTLSEVGEVRGIECNYGKRFGKVSQRQQAQTSTSAGARRLHAPYELEAQVRRARAWHDFSRWVKKGEGKKKRKQSEKRWATAAPPGGCKRARKGFIHSPRPSGSSGSVSKSSIHVFMYPTASKLRLTDSLLLITPL